MSNRYEYPQISATGQVTNDSASLEVVSSPGSVTYLTIERVNFSVFEAASGGGGICELKDTDGVVLYTFNVDGIKDIHLNFGDEGLKIGPDKGLQFVVSGASTKQASVSIAFNGHTSFR
jgi:hypothetical protein